MKATKKVYTYKDVFTKTCYIKNGEGKCEKTHNAVKCVDNVCKKVERPVSKQEVLKSIYNESKQLGGKGQYYGKKSDVMVKVPENVKRAAEYSYILKKMGFKGGMETGWKRAKQLSTKEYIPIQDVKYMRNWFARHVYASYPTYKKWKDAGKPKTFEWHNRHGIISWQIWGADPALKWVNSKKVRNMLSDYYGKEFNTI
jgi:hypothetical protein